MTVAFLLIYAFLFFYIAFIIKRTIGSYRNPLSFFSLLWCVVGFVSNLGLKDYYLPSDTVNIIIITGILIFFIAFYSVFNNYPLSVFSKDIVINEDNINYHIVIIVNLACIVFEIPALIRSLNMIRTLGMAYVRAHGSLVYNSLFFNQISETVVKPVFTATTILAVIISFFRERYKILPIIAVAIVDNIIFTIITAGRAPIVNAVFYLLIAAIIIRGKSILVLLKKEKRKTIFLLGAIALIILVSSLRANSRIGLEQITGSAYIYYFSGPSYLSRLLEHNNEYGIGGKLMYGQATFGFITNWFVVALDPLFGGKLETSLNILGSNITNIQFAVGNHTRVNSMSTCFYAFLVDWGYLGVVLGPIVLAIITKIIVKRMDRKSSILNIGIYIYWLYMLFRTAFKWDMVSLDFFVICFALYIFTMSLKKNTRKAIHE